jgi:hypothetical protein
VSKTPRGPTDEWLALYQVSGATKWLEPLKLGMNTDDYWGFQASYGRCAHALIRWEAPYQERMRARFSKPASGYAAFFLNKDRGLLEQWLADSLSWYGRFRHMHTAAEQKTDRVFTFNASTPVACYLGDAPNRNRWVRYNAVSYEDLRGEDFAALVWDADEERLRVALYNFADRPLTGRARVWRLDHGRFRVRVGPDADDDGNMDAAVEDRTMELQRFAAIPLTLPPRQVTILQAEMVERLDDIRGRPDLALSEREVEVKDGVLSVTVHNIGAAPAEADAAVLDADGRVVARQSLGRLEAPLDLEPRRKTFAFRLPAGPHKGWRLVLDPDGKVPEICEDNNVVALER